MSCHKSAQAQNSGELPLACTCPQRLQNTLTLQREQPPALPQDPGLQSPHCSRSSPLHCPKTLACKALTAAGAAPCTVPRPWPAKHPLAAAGAAPCTAPRPWPAKPSLQPEQPPALSQDPGLQSTPSLQLEQPPALPQDPGLQSPHCSRSSPLHCPKTLACKAPPRCSWRAPCTDPRPWPAKPSLQPEQPLALPQDPGLQSTPSLQPEQPLHCTKEIALSSSPKFPDCLEVLTMYHKPALEALHDFSFTPPLIYHCKSY
ncbi:predicted GPI-anchored protein 58 isoform X2 [Dermochelys coriacea]|uniref:predicted GPI-anchored protein 58 isoform X2 n=1 Tax=Dermochelys coriacea TaxID=27794 RepID=UPI001CA905C6|nr:predicted GPI-anchored protein 58 isoform X2 [Dermochelys coriacea]